LRGIGARLRSELLHAPVEDLREIEIAVLIDRNGVRSVQLTRLPAGPAPPVEIFAIQVVLQHPIGPAVRDPQELIGRDDVRVRRRANARRPHVEEVAVLVESLDAPMAPINDEQPSVLADLNAVDGVELARSRILRILRRRAPVREEPAVLVELRDAGAAVAVADEERTVGQPVDVRGPIEQPAAFASALAFRA